MTPEQAATRFHTEAANRGNSVTMVSVRGEAGDDGVYTEDPLTQQVMAFFIEGTTAETGLNGARGDLYVPGIGLERSPKNGDRVRAVNKEFLVLDVTPLRAQDTLVAWQLSLAEQPPVEVSP